MRTALVSRFTCDSSWYVGSTFALNFKKQVGLSRMDYLTKWRVQTACELLEAGSQNISEIANAVGYESESAFSVAGVTPLTGQV